MNNANLIALPSERYASQILRDKKYDFPDMKNTSESRTSIPFHVVLVDPPRAGLDDVTLKLVSHYDHILYISCSPGL